MNKFEKPSESERPDDLWALLSPQEREELERIFSAMSPGARKEIESEIRKMPQEDWPRLIEAIFQSDRYSKEVVESEIEEWSNVVEKASNVEERKRILRAILQIASLERTMVKLTSIKSNDSVSKDARNIINRMRAEFGLPPKYS